MWLGRVEHGDVATGESEMLHVAHDANNLARARAAYVQLPFLRDAPVIGDASTQRVLAGPELFRHRLADDHHPRSVDIVAHVEQAAARKRNPHDVEIVGARGARLRGRAALTDHLWAVVELESVLGIIAAQRKNVGRAHDDHVRKSSDPLIERVIERDLLAFLIASSRKG